jgi:hypothetical protein
MGADDLATGTGHVPSVSEEVSQRFSRLLGSLVEAR